MEGNVLISEYGCYWGRIPALGELLGNERIPDHYYGPSSISDNVFRKVRRLMEIHILIHENQDRIRSVMKRGDVASRQLRKELEWVSKALAQTAQMFANESEQVEQIAGQ